MEHPTRREIMMAGAALTMAGTRASADPVRPPPGAVVTAVGTVTESGSEPGATGQPLADVLVSNGRDVVRTGVDGRYSLSVAPGQSIFVIKPAGFQVPLDPATRLPRFSYVHDPAGTPAELGFRYRGLPPTGPLPPSIDFKLTRVAEPDRFDVLMFTDTQPESTAEIEFIRDDVVSGLIGTKAAFGVNCGDIAFDDLSMYGRINRIIGRIGVPFWNVGGNHDLDFEAPDAHRARDTYKRVFGAPYYAHACGKALFIMLDNVDYFGAAAPKSESVQNYRGNLAQDQLTFVENLLKLTPVDRLIVLVMHIPLKTYLGSDAPRRTANGADLLKLLGNRPAVSFAGHTHSTEHHYFGATEGFTGAVPHHHHVLTAVSGAWWSGPRDHRGIASADSYDGTPNGHHVLSIDGTRYTTRFVPAAEPGERQMRLSLESQFHQDDAQVEQDLPMIEVLRSPITAEQAAGVRLVVNVFAGGPKTKVSFSLDGGAPTQMTQAAGPDPFIVQVYGRHKETIKRWVKPQISSHLWAAPLPPGLGVGTYAVQVRAIDEYGRVHSDGMVLEVV